MGAWEIPSELLYIIPSGICPAIVIPTTATLLGWAFFHSKFPSLQNWVSLAFVLVAVTFLTRAERKRALELKVAKEI